MAPVPPLGGVGQDAIMASVNHSNSPSSALQTTGKWNNLLLALLVTLSVFSSVFRRSKGSQRYERLPMIYILDPGRSSRGSNVKRMLANQKYFGPVDQLSELHSNVRLRDHMIVLPDLQAVNNGCFIDFFPFAIV